jgi:hypothetical protein
MKLGDAFLMSVPPDFECSHLFFVISDPDMHGGTFVIANITGDEFRAGKECVLVPGDHPWIKKQCFVTFSDALEITPNLSQMITALIGSKVTIQPCLRAAVLTKIVRAAKQSEAIPEFLKQYL